MFWRDVNRVRKGKKVIFYKEQKWESIEGRREFCDDLLNFRDDKEDEKIWEGVGGKSQV